MATKFGRLSEEEFILLEESFIQFLVVQGIDASSWVKIKEEKPDQMNQLLDQFSDYVHYSSLISCQFVSKMDKGMLYTSQISKDKIASFTLKLTEADLANIDSEEDLYVKLDKKEIDIAELTFESSLIDGDREMYIYELLTKEHFKIDKGRLYKSLALLQAER